MINGLPVVLIDGECISLTLFQNMADMRGCGIWFYIHLYIGPLVTFVYTYSRILLVIKRQNQVFAVQAGTSANQSSYAHTRMNVTKTMLYVCILYTVCWFPINVYYLELNVVNPGLGLLSDGYYACLIFLAFSNICINPFIYGSKHKDASAALKRWAARLTCCSKPLSTSFPDTAMSTVN